MPCEKSREKNIFQLFLASQSMHQLRRMGTVGALGVGKFVNFEVSFEMPNEPVALPINILLVVQSWFSDLVK